MKRSTERILTTHVGSLPRPADLRAMWAKKTVTAEDEGALQTRLRSAIGEIVRAQKSAGIDIPNDGEFGKPMRAATDRGAWGNYIFDRVSGFTPTSAQTLAPDTAKPGAADAHRRRALGAARVRGILRRHRLGRAQHRGPAPDLHRRRSLTPRSSFCATSSST